MRFRTRAFLLSFVPFTVLLTASFWMIQRLVQTTVREELRTSLRANQNALSHIRAKNDLRNIRFLQAAGENASLKAGMQLLAAEKGNGEARLTVEDQLRDLSQHMGFDFLFVSAGGAPVAGVLRTDGHFAPMDLTRRPSVDNGLILLGGSAYQIASVPIDQADENIGSLSVGELLDLSEFSTAAVLLSDGKVLMSSVPGSGPRELEKALSQCPDRRECDFVLGGAKYVSWPMAGFSNSAKQLVRSVQNEDSAIRPVRAFLQRAFAGVLIVAVLVAVVFSVVSSRSIVKPIVQLIAHLRKTESTGLLPEFETDSSPIREIRDLTNRFNVAAGSIREARNGLQKAYIESVGSLANALDARDRYTAGHSLRVSTLSCATARGMGLQEEQIERIRVGALLHDIGKIGIPDAVLNKPGKLTDVEYELVQQHPAIGRRILEGVNGFAPYLDAVELHHENWNGTGYPHGQKGEQTPIEARIIHVSDAYDAMTSDRPYRRGMSHEKAIAALHANAGKMFDQRVVSIFARLELPGSVMELDTAPDSVLAGCA